MHSDFEILSNRLFAIVKPVLEEHGKALPVGAVVTLAGAIEIVTAGGSGDSTSEEVVQQILIKLRVKHHIRACAFLYTGTIELSSSGKTEVLCVQAETADCQAIAIVMPYRKLPSGRYSYQDLILKPGTCNVFPQ